MSRTGIVTCLAIGVVAAASLAVAEPPLAEVTYFGTSVEFSPTKLGHGFLLKVATPDGSVVDKTVKAGVPSFDLSELKGPIVDGRYKYELRLIVSQPRQRGTASYKSIAAAKPRVKVPSLSGSFLVSGGSIVSPEGMDSKALSVVSATPQSGPDAPDAEITEDLCVGSSCVSGETFDALSTLKLKELDTGIHFDDMDSSPFPHNDWMIQANDSFSGGNNYLAIVDYTAGTMPFKVEAGAPNNSLLVSPDGDVSIGNSLPGWNLHITDGLMPGVRLEQDTSLGQTPYIWDVVGWDGGFFIGDYTGGAYIPFLIEPGAPQYSIVMKYDGKIGFGTVSPAYQFEVERTGVNSAVVVQRTDGATNYINATASFGNFGTVTDHPLRLVVNSAWKMRINNDSSIVMANGASLTAGGVWTDASSRELKKEIRSLSIEKATAALADLDPVEFAFKSNGERHVGFIAEDVPELVAGAEHNGLSPMDVVAVLTRVVQQQQIVDLEQKKLLQDQRKHTESLQATINQLLARISALESQ